MNKILTTIALLLGLTAATKAQTIQMNLPYFAGMTYTFIIFQGEKQITVQKDSIPRNGVFTLKVPKEYAPYTGMGRWQLENGGLDIVIPGKDFSISCMVEKPTKQDDFVYKGDSNTPLLNTLLGKQRQLLGKANAISNVLNTFDKSEKNYPIFEEEYRKLQKDYAAFQQNAVAQKSYAASVFNIFGIPAGVGTELCRTQEESGKSIADYITHRLDWDVLYTSGHWTDVIASFVGIHVGVLKDKAIFATDFWTIGEKLKGNAARYTDFAGKVAYYLTQQGMDDYIALIAPMVKESGLVNRYEGALMAYQGGSAGSHAADLELTTINGTQKVPVTELAGADSSTLLIFYETGCGLCENLFRELPGKYEHIRSKGVKVIAISADESKEKFKSKASTFPWKDSYCDYKGKSGVNFRNYGVVGTPTLFLIDKNGMVKARMAELSEVLAKLGE